MRTSFLLLALFVLGACGKGGSSNGAGANAVAPGPGRVQLNWTAPAGNVSGYYVEQSSSGGAFSTVQTVIAPTTSATLTGLTLGTPYQFRVRAFTGGGTSAYTATVSATP